MTTTPPAAGTPVTPAGSASTIQGLNSLASTFNSFLTLLTTQLKNQDPTSPMDSSQFTQQLVQMTGVEQQLNSNALLGQLVTNTSNTVPSAVNLIGHSVKGASDTANLSGGQAKWTYNLSGAAKDLKLEVIDAKGRVVHVEAPASRTAGDHAFTWNGKDLSGQQLSNGGTYTLKVTATDDKAAAIPTTTSVSGVVTGVVVQDGATAVVVNGGTVFVSHLISVDPPPPAAGATPTA